MIGFALFTGFMLLLIAGPGAPSDTNKIVHFHGEHTVNKPIYHDEPWRDDSGGLRPAKTWERK